MGWSRQTPDPAEEIRHQQNVAIAFGGALVAIGLAGLTTAAVLYIADTHNAGALWFKGLWIGGAGLVIFGLYPLAAVPILGAPFPKPRSNFILRPMWDRMPFSKSARHKRSVAHFQASERVFRERLQREVQAAGLDAGRAAQTLLEEVVEPPPVASRGLDSLRRYRVREQREHRPDYCGLGRRPRGGGNVATL
jgi:hypothetical protein